MLNSRAVLNPLRHPLTTFIHRLTPLAARRCRAHDQRERLLCFDVFQLHTATGAQTLPRPFNPLQEGRIVFELPIADC
jgi:hypothetical protein